MNVSSTQTPLPQGPTEDPAVAGEDGGVPALWRRDGAETRRMLAAYEEAKWVVEALDAEHERDHGRPLTTSERERLFFYQAWRMRGES